VAQGMIFYEGIMKVFFYQSKMLRVSFCLFLIVISGCKKVGRQEGLSAFQSSSQIINCYAIKDVHDYVIKDSLVVFDVDCTLLFPYCLKNNGNGSREIAKKRLAYMWYKDWQNYIKIQAGEPDTAQVVNQLQRSGIKVMAFTSRPIKIKKVTEEQLRLFGIDMNKNTFLDQEIIVKPTEKKHGFGFSGGILMTNKNKKITKKQTKGETLLQFFDHIGYKPSRVIFVDDDKRNIISVTAALRSRNIPVISLWYRVYEKECPIFQEKEFKPFAQEL
jgi:hypothetical protein